MKRVSAKTLLALIVIISITISHAYSVKAATDNAQGLQISPVLVEILADPGKTYSFKISILNVTTGDLLFKPIINDFQSKDDSGEPAIILDGTVPSTTLKGWISPIPDITVKAKKSVEVNVSITVPLNAEPGGHYGVVRFSGIAPALDKSGVSLAASAGPLVLVRVSGAVKESLVVKDFYAVRGKNRSVWFESSPVTFVEKITNTGNTHLKPVGNLVITNMFGGTTASLKINDEKGNVLPSGTRSFSQKLESKRMFGRYTAKLALAYGSTGQALTGTITFWVIPYKLILLSLATLIILFIAIKNLIGKYNRAVIKKALNETNKKEK